MTWENDWCDDCGCPIGVGPCAGCCAYAVACEYDPPEDDDWEDEDDD